MKKNYNKGFSLVELLIGVAVFSIIVVSVYDAFTSIFNVVFTSKAKIDAIDLVNEQLEIARNLPYADVGIVGGIPAGKLSHTQTITRDAYQFVVTTTVRNIDDPFDGTLGGVPNDSSPVDYKLVEIQVDCALCRRFIPIVVTTFVGPKNLETASTNGALFVKVFDANGVPIQGASVHIENNQISPPIVIDDVTDANGMLQVVDAPPGVNAYEITVTKAGYSTDKTYASSVSNPNPTKPHATVALQQVTQLSFVIDKVSTFSFSSVTSSCLPVGGVNFSLTGAKLIGTNPNIFKYNQNKITDGGGLLTINNIEWDTYTVTPTDTVYDLIGLSPLSPVSISPNSTQSVQLIVAPKNPNTLLVTVKDGVTNLPLSGVSVTLGNFVSSTTAVTGQGFLTQTDWSGGAGQATSTDSTKYLSSDGNIDTASPVGELKLKKVLGDYVSSGVLTSSSFNLGSISNFGQLYWNPGSQPASVGTPSIRFQLATNNNGGTWNYTGPDGTAATYYSSSNQNINPINNGNQYLRYKLFMDTGTTTATPDIADVSFTFTSLCTPPGQVSFSALSAGSYTLHLSKAGYVDQDISVGINTGWQKQDVILMSN